MPLSKRTLAYLALITNALIWGAALPIVKPALNHTSPYHFLFFRYLFGCIVSIPLLIPYFKKKFITINKLLIIVLLEFLGITLALGILYQGLKLTSALEASFLANTSPIFITIGGILFLKEKQERHEWLGLLIAFLGVMILVVEPILKGDSITSISYHGNFLIIIYNLCWTAYLLLSKKLYQNIPKFFIGLVSLWVGLISFALITLTSAPITGLLTPLSHPSVIVASIYMGVLGSIIAVPAVIYGNSIIEASEASLFTYLQPLVYLPLATIWLKEPMSPLVILSLLLVAIGVITAEYRSKTKKTRTKFKKIR